MAGWHHCRAIASICQPCIPRAKYRLNTPAVIKQRRKLKSVPYIVLLPYILGFLGVFIICPIMPANPSPREVQNTPIPNGRIISGRRKMMTNRMNIRLSTMSLLKKSLLKTPLQRPEMKQLLKLKKKQHLRLRKKQLLKLRKELPQKQRQPL